MIPQKMKGSGMFLMLFLAILMAGCDAPAPTAKTKTKSVPTYAVDGAQWRTVDGMPQLVVPAEGCEGKVSQIRFENLPHDYLKDSPRSWLVYNDGWTMSLKSQKAVRVLDNERVEPGKYIRFTLMAGQYQPHMDFIAAPENEKCANDVSFPGYSSGVGVGIIVMDEGIRTVGTWTLKLYAEEPTGSGHYVLSSKK